MDIQYAELKFKHTQIITLEEWEGYLQRLACGALTELLSKSTIIVDDPYEPTTPEQQKKIMKWFTNWKDWKGLSEDKDGSSGTP